MDEKERTNLQTKTTPTSNSSASRSTRRRHGNSKPNPKKQPAQPKRNDTSPATTTNPNNETTAASRTMPPANNKNTTKASQGRRQGGVPKKKPTAPKDQDTAQTKPYTKKNPKTTTPYPEHYSYQECLTRLHQQPGLIVRGKLRVPPGGSSSFVTSTLYAQDICIPTELDRNRAMDGDTVFVEVINHATASKKSTHTTTDSENDMDYDDLFTPTDVRATTDDSAPDPVQMDLWNPAVSIPKHPNEDKHEKLFAQEQPKGRVIHVEIPSSTTQERLPPSELDHLSVTNAKPSKQENADPSHPRRVIVGTLKILQSGTVLLTPTNKSLPQFRCNTAPKQQKENTLYQAEYKYGAWKTTHKWPPCTNLQPLGEAFDIETEIQGLLIENQVNHGNEFPAQVSQDVDSAIESGRYSQLDSSIDGWKPTADMYKNRRDFTKERIFTIDPTTAKDLDDALHIRELPDGRVEIGVHIADVSYFVRPHTAVDREAQRRATTVYLVDRTIPMLPRPLCEVACSLNENVERLAFSCVWKMNRDGTLRTKNGKVSQDSVWYGRSVIRSCARLDYATAQNIIDGKVATGESINEMSEEYWPPSRRPTGVHTIDQVATDVRLMHKVAMARRKLRFDNGALGLHGIKLTFKLDADGQTPLLAAPYPIRDSNRLVEEYMLLANYLVAQRLITHAKKRALLRHHPEPLDEGLDKVAAVAKAGINFFLDTSDSKALHNSLVRLSKECSKKDHEDNLVLQCVTQMLMTPMQPADYFAAGTKPAELWRHFALNIPYYTHFTSPIRRYADVIVHRLLQATIDETVDNFEMNASDIDTVCVHCNEKRMASKTAQERCDRIFLALYVNKYPMKGELGVVVSVGASAFTVFVPSIGANVLLYLQEHEDVLEYTVLESSGESDTGERAILLTQKSSTSDVEGKWNLIRVEVFTKLFVTVYCRDKPPVDVKLRLEGPYHAP